MDEKTQNQQPIETSGGFPPWRLLVENLPFGLCLFADRKAAYINRALIRIMGLESVEEAAKIDPLSLVPVSEHKRLLGILDDRLAGKPAPRHYSTTLRRTTGEEFPAEIFSRLVEIDGKRAVQITVIDASEIRRIERHERLLATAVEQSSEGVCLVDLGGNVLECNRAFAELHGRPAEDLIGKPLSIFHSPGQMPAVEAANEQIRRTGRFIGEIWHTRAGGQAFLAAMNNTLLRDEQGRPFAMLGTLRDITPEKQAEKLTLIQRDLGAALGAASGMDEALAAILDAALSIEEVDSGGIYLLDEKSKTLRLAAHRGLTPEFINAVSVEPADSRRGETALKGEPVYLDYATLAPGIDPPRQSEGLAGLACLPVKHQGKVIAVMNLASHRVSSYSEPSRRALELIAAQVGAVIVRVKMEMDLAREKEQLAITLCSIGEAVIATDREVRITLMNPAAERLLGTRERDVLGLPLDSVYRTRGERPGEAARHPLEEALSSARASGPSFRALIGREERPVVIEESASPILGPDGKVLGAVLIFRDVTQTRKMEEEMIRAEKLESLGLLAGGIAHDFNNILTGILGNIALARLNRKNGKELERRLEEAEKACMFASDLAQQLLVFSRGGEPVFQIAPPGKVLREATEFALRGSSSSSEFDLPAGLWPVSMDRGQIGQVIQNLAINADQSMPGGGTVSVRAENIRLEREDRDARHGQTPGPYVKIIISDRGVGIPENALSRIFDPFYTTKEKGSGLGLAISYSIVRRHGGEIKVSSRPGEGTEFSIFLPAMPGAEVESGEQQKDLITGQGRVLVLEDQETISEFLRFTLEELGYQASLAAEGRAAVDEYKRARERGEPFDAVIMDMTIPGGMGGKEAIGLLLQIDPNVKAVVSSGYATDPVLAEPARFGFKAALSKPYSPEQLSRVLARVIGGGK